MEYSKQLGILVVVALTTTVVWLVLLITSLIGTLPPETFEEALASVYTQGTLAPSFYLTYVNAVLVTLSTTALFAGLYVYNRRRAPFWSMVGLVFVPAYSVLALVVYTSQITIVPWLADLHTTPAHQPAVEVFLGQIVQGWAGSTVWVLNNLAYAVLGIPSIIFGLLLVRHWRRLRLAGSLLALSGVASIVGMAGIVARNELFSSGSIVGGALYLLALIPLALVLLQRPRGYAGED